MEYYDGKLCAGYGELVEGSSPLVKRGTLNSWLSRGTVQYARRAHGRGVSALIDVSTLPEATRRALVERSGLPEEPTPEEVQPVTELYRDLRALEYYSAHTYDVSGEEQHLTDDLIREYTINASVLNALLREAKRLRMEGNKLNNNRRDIRTLVHRLSEMLRETSGHTLPGSERRLWEKVRVYAREGYKCLVSEALGNDNSRKITREAGEYLVAMKLSRLPRYSNAQIFTAYNATAPAYGWKPLESEQALRSYLYSPAVKPLWYGHVQGELEKYKKYGYKHKTVLPSERDSLWYVDGTKLNLYYRRGGKPVTMNVVEVIDAATECLLGYSLCETEDFRAQYRAVRMALEVAGERPYELVHDNQGGQKSGIATEWLDRVAIVHRTTQPYRPQSKSIEALFGRLQKQVMSRCPWFTGTNVTAKGIEGRPDMEWLAANMNLLPSSVEELERQYVEMRDEWNSLPHPRTGIARWEMYRASRNEALRPLSKADREELFLLERPRAITFRGEGLTMEMDGVEYSYDAYILTDGTPLVDTQWRSRHIDESFIVRYDPEDLSAVYLYREEAGGGRRLERKLRSKVVIHRAIQEQTESDHEAIRAIQAQDKRARIEMEAESRAITRLYRVGRPSLEPDPKTLTAADLKLLDELTDAKTRTLRERYRAKGIDPLLHRQEEGEEVVKPAEVTSLGRLQKEISMTTWDEVEVVTVPRKEEEPLSSPGAPLLGTHRPESLREQIRRKI